MIESTVTVIGAGYAGIVAANRVQASLTPGERGRVRVVVINATGDFVERVRLHELAAGARDSVTIPLAEMLHPDVEVVVGRVVAIDADARRLTIESASGVATRQYSTLVYAVGSVSALGAPGAEEFAHLLGNPDGAETARVALAAGRPDQRVVVVGGGATGVEAAAEFAEQYPAASVTLLSRGGVLGNLGVGARRGVLRSLARLGVHVVEQASVARVLADGVSLEGGEVLPSDVTVWAASFAVPDLARTSGLPVDTIGRLLVDERLRVVGHPEIFGAGDAVRPPDSVGAHLRMGCAIAMPIGAHAADNVLAALRGGPLARLDVGFAAQCISIGRREGVIQLLTRADRPTALRITGRAGAWVKEWVCTVLATGAPRREREKPGSLLMIKGPRNLPSPAGR
jgi:NADH dehydrogenase